MAGRAANRRLEWIERMASMEEAYEIDTAGLSKTNNLLHSPCLSELCLEILPHRCNFAGHAVRQGFAPRYDISASLVLLCPAEPRGLSDLRRAVGRRNRARRGAVRRATCLTRHNCGNSSTLSERNTRPIGVIRGSRLVVTVVVTAGSSRIVRNLARGNTHPPRPMRA